MKTMKTFLITSSLFMIMGMVGCKEEEDPIWELHPGGKQTVIQNELSGISFTLYLINEEGKPATVFNEGENFYFYFSIKNNSGKNYYYNAYECGYITDFFRVFSSIGVDYGKSYKVLPMPDLGETGYPFNNGDTYTFKIPWMHSEVALFEGEDFSYQSVLRDKLKKGTYYTSFKNGSYFVGNDANKNIKNDLYFRINFKIQ